MSASQTKALHALAEPIVAQFDADLEEVVIRQAGKRRLVRVVVDADEGLTLDLVASVSRAVAQALDDSSVLGNQPYVLEVTSPGVDRPLRLPRHWQRALGRLVRVTDRSGGTREGRLVEVGAQEVHLDIEGVTESIALADVSRAVVQVEFTRVEETDLETDGPETDETDAPTGPDEGSGSDGANPAEQED